jgi:hypothetical protein
MGNLARALKQHRLLLLQTNTILTSADSGLLVGSAGSDYARDASGNSVAQFDMTTTTPEPGHAGLTRWRVFAIQALLSITLVAAEDAHEGRIVFRTFVAAKIVRR